MSRVPASSDGAVLEQGGWPEPVRNRRAKRLFLRAMGIQERVRSGREILLTFDDGPDPSVTPAVLEALREAKARAVFFVLGKQVEKYPDLVRRTQDEGHIIGNHTYTHTAYGRFTLFEYLEDVKRCQEAVAKVLGRSPTYFRPPEGRLTVGSLSVPLLCGLHTMYWSLDPRDFSLETSEQANLCADQLAAQTRPGDILLLHDVNPALPRVLARLLPQLRERGMDSSESVKRLESRTPYQK